MKRVKKTGSKTNARKDIRVLDPAELTAISGGDGTASPPPPPPDPPPPSKSGAKQKAWLC